MTRELGRAVESVVVALDGESKCGKTTIVENIAQEALFQAGIIPQIIAGDPSLTDVEFSAQSLKGLQELQDHLSFNAIITISAGNMFRGATLYKKLLEQQGQTKFQFDDSDTDKLRELLAKPGINDFLQNDPNIGKSVTPVAKMLGVQALCGSVFCDEVKKAYHANGGGNLVVIDARDPLGHMERNNLIGRGAGQIHPASIMPIYIDTPPKVAASWFKGDAEAKLAEIEQRRFEDATRDELPVTRPSVLTNNYNEWLGELLTGLNSREVPVTPYRFDNNKDVKLDNIQHFGGRIAVVAQELGHNLFHLNPSRSPHRIAA